VTVTTGWKPRPDSTGKITGRTLYAADLSFPGALETAVLRSPHPFARIRRIDVGSARAMPGVVAVAYAGNTPRKRLDFGIKDQQLFAGDYARYAGEPIAAIAAETRSAALAAAHAIEVDYEVLEPVLTIDDALRPDGPLVHPDWRHYEKKEGRTLDRNVCHRNFIRRGDVDAALAQAAVVVESRFTFSHGMPGYLEPRCAVARGEPDGGLTIWCGSQSPYGARDDIAAFFDVPVEKTRCINQMVGGGFGGKLIMGAEWFAAALALQCDRPVRVAWSRREDSLNVYPRHGGTASFVTGAGGDGTLLAMRAAFVFDTGAYLEWGSGTALIATMLASAPYRIPNLDLRGTLVYTNKQVAGPVRAPGGTQTNFAKESHLDEVARTLDMDPLEFRLKNVWHDGDLGPAGQLLAGVSAEEALRAAAQAVGWGTRRVEGRGRGLCCTWWFSSCTESRARIEIDAAGKIRVHSGNAEIGTGSAASALPMIAAGVLGVDAGEVEMILADTASDAYDGGVGGSGSTYGSGMAVENAARDAREKLLALAENAFEARADDIELRNGNATVRGSPDHVISLGELAASAGGLVMGSGASDEGAGDPEFDESLVESHDVPSFRDPSFTATAAEVEVDRETGRVTVRKLATAQDVGHAVNLPGIIGQIEGGAVQGLGWALTEELKFEHGRMVDPGFRSYLLPTAVDAPAIEAIVIEKPSAQGPHGMKGVGEPPVTTPAGAIANAIRDAVGVAPTHAPMTPERVWRALEAGRNTR
jgi:CO/xanthine dehydrogenase Mo-binding subunit